MIKKLIKKLYRGIKNLMIETKQERDERILMKARIIEQDQREEAVRLQKEHIQRMNEFERKVCRIVSRNFNIKPIDPKDEG